MAELRRSDDAGKRLTREERASLLAMLDAYDTTDPQAWRPLTDYWKSLDPPEHGNYPYLRVSGMERHALRGMRAVALTTAWGRPR